MAKRLVEVFVTGCPLCDGTVKLVRELACPNCEVKIYDLHEGDAQGREKTTQYGIHRVPAVVVDGKLAECCQNQQPVSREALLAAGVGQR
ncbi:MAG: thioredoxin family protein [Coleofasciculaceae cyanobacterium]